MDKDPRLDGYDPINDEKKQFTLEEWTELAKKELDLHQKVWSEEPRNEFHRATHTWDEWFNSFHRYMSW